MCTSKSVIAVTSRRLCERPFLEQIRSVCEYGPRAIILREKDLSEEEYEKLAAQVLEICREFQVRCILHTYPDAARKLENPYIHLPMHLLRTYAGQLGDFERVGTSVHSAEEAVEAERLGADYLTAGHVYTTDCKKGLPPRGLEFLREVVQAVKLPVYAIGGIHLGTGQIEEVQEAGAEGACIMSGMMNGKQLNELTSSIALQNI